MNDKKYYIYDHEFGDFIVDNNERKKRGIFYAIIMLAGLWSIAFIVFKFQHTVNADGFTLQDVFKETDIVQKELNKRFPPPTNATLKKGDWILISINQFIKG